MKLSLETLLPAHGRRRLVNDRFGGRALALFAAALVTFCWALMWWAATDDRRRTEADAKAELATITLAVAQHTARTLDLADNVGRFVGFEYARLGRAVDLTRLAANGVADPSMFPQVGVIDPAGDYVASSLGKFAPINLSDREHFRVQLLPDLPQPFISKPLVGRASGRPALQITRRITAPDGQLLGVSVVSLDPNYFINSFRPLVSRDGFMAVIGLDGAIRISVDQKGNPVPLNAGKLQEQFSRDRVSGFIAYAPVAEGERHLIAYHRVPGYPLLVFSGTTVGEISQPHDERVRSLLLAAVLFSGLLLILMFAVYWAIAGLRRTNLELESSRAQAEAANELKTRFLSQISHELRTPLHGIIGHADLLTRERDGPDALDSANSILASGSHLLNLVNELLDVAKIEAGHESVRFERVDLTEVLRAAVRGQEPDARLKEVELHAHLPDRLEVWADRVATNRIIHNLLNNAIKFTPRGSIEVTAEAGPEMAKVTVRDTGIGISAEDRAKLFGLFVQTGDFETRRFAGSGLGLYLCRQLVTLMGGEIGAAPTPGGGSTFWFTLRYAT